MLETVQEMQRVGGRKKSIQRKGERYYSYLVCGNDALKRGCRPPRLFLDRHHPPHRARTILKSSSSVEEDL